MLIVYSCGWSLDIQSLLMHSTLHKQIKYFVCTTHSQLMFCCYIPALSHSLQICLSHTCHFIIIFSHKPHDKYFSCATSSINVRCMLQLLMGCEFACIPSLYHHILYIHGLQVLEGAALQTFDTSQLLMELMIQELHKRTWTSDRMLYS